MAARRSPMFRDRMDEQSDPFLARRSLAPDHRRPPVVVVGLPRSGSSYLSHLMSQLEDWFVFDDLYLYRQARALGADGALDPEQLHRLVDFLGWQLRARLKYDRDFVQLRCRLDEVDGLCEAVEAALGAQPVRWHELLEEWMVRLALRHGRTRWGYKAPQDFMHMEELAALFPGVRFVFIVRDPRQTMASFKYVRGEDGAPGQYHPLVYARYWRMAHELTERSAAEHGLPLLRVRFEELVADPLGQGRRIAAFLGTRLEEPLVPMGANTSFRAGERRDITPTERWLCERVTGPRLADAGYAASGARPRLRDVPDLMATTLRFAAYQGRRLWRDPAARESVRGYLARLRAR